MRLAVTLVAAAVATGSAAQPSAKAALPASQTAGADAEAKLALDLMRSQPVGLPLVGDTLGWVKRCTGTPSVCTVSRGFALDSVTFPSLKTTFVITPDAGIHAVGIMVPLDQSLKDGFVIRGDGQQGYLGTYSRCSPLGCAGDVIVTDKAYYELVAAKLLDVIVVDVNGRTVTYQAPLEGLAAASQGPAMSEEAFAKATRAAGEELVSRVQALQAKTNAEAQAVQPAGTQPDAAVQSATDGQSPTDGTSTGGADQPAGASTPLVGNTSATPEPNHAD